MGDGDGFVDRFDELFGVAYRAAFVVLGDRDEAQDCAQETLARAFDRWPRIREHVVAWVARTATNLAIDRWRRQRRARAAPAATSGAVLDHVDLRRDELVTALRALPRRQREAVVLRHLLDLSEHDAATVMRCSTGTVKSATHRGLDRLRLALGPTWGLEH